MDPYKQGLPCLNPACKSQGKPHPNCKCYSHFAEGGDVSHYCSARRVHNQDCEYFKHSNDTLESVATALLHSGAKHLLTGDMHGVYGDPEQSLPRFARNASRGSKAIDAHIEHLFGGERPDTPTPTSEDRDKLNDFLEKGKLNEHIATYASGGAVGHSIETAFPEHNMMIQEVKSRVHNYLSSLRPHAGEPTLPFDRKASDHAQKRSYEKALDLANHPVSILSHVKKGSLTPDEVRHFKAMYPEIHDHLSKKMTERIVKYQLDHESKPSHQVRQSMSLFLGTALDSTLTPASIQAAQNVFVRQSQMKQTKKATSKLGDQAKGYLTPDQAAISRQQRAR